MSAATLRVMPPLLTGAVAVLGGAFLGFSSCGGYWWHEQAIFGTFASAIAASILVPHPCLTSWRSRLLFACSALALFPLAGAAGATFYPETPPSLAEFLSMMWMALVDGGSC